MSLDKPGISLRDYKLAPPIQKIPYEPCERLLWSISRTCTHLVRVFYEDVFALRLLHAKICHGPDNTPSIRKRNIELSSKVSRPNRLRAQNNMASMVSWVGTGDVTIWESILAAECHKKDTSIDVLSGRTRSS